MKNEKIIQSKLYTIYIDNNVLKKLSAFLKKEKYSDFFILCDQNTMKHCLPVLISSCKLLAKAEIIETENGEDSKSLEVASYIWQTLLEKKADKKTLIINLGGGVICDLGGFVSSVYKRGIDFINIPTTLLAMADASIGGKNGINFLNIKNAIGTITQPKSVFIYPPFLKTLPKRHYLNGMAEIFKTAIISDKLLWKKLLPGIYSLKEDELIYKSISLKHKIVQKDPLEKNIRKALNFGHTIGHAIEAVLLNTKDELYHGEAVNIGMIAESFIAHQKKLIRKDELNEIISGIKNTFTLNAVPVNHFGTIYISILNDKKNNNGRLLFSLIKGIGKPAINEAVNEKQIITALEFYNSVVK